MEGIQAEAVGAADFPEAGSAEEAIRVAAARLGRKSRNSPPPALLHLLRMEAGIQVEETLEAVALVVVLARHQEAAHILPQAEDPFAHLLLAVDPAVLRGVVGMVVAAAGKQAVLPSAALWACSPFLA